MRTGLKLIGTHGNPNLPKAHQRVPTPRRTFPCVRTPHCKGKQNLYTFLITKKMTTIRNIVTLLIYQL